MATITITNLTGAVVHVGDLYADIPANGALVLNNRSALELDGMQSLKDLILATSVSVSIAYSAADVAAGFMTPAQSVQAVDIIPVVADGSMNPVAILRKAMVAGGGGADDVTIYAAGQLPFKMRVCDVFAFVKTAAGGSTVAVRTRAAGAGTLLSTVDSAATGRVAGAAPSDATVVATPGALEGLFLRRSDNTVVGEVFVLLRPES